MSVQLPLDGPNGHNQQEWGAQIPYEVLSSRNLPDGAKLVYCALERRCIGKDTCWPSLMTLSHDVGRSVGYVKRGLAALTEAGMVETRCGGHRSPDRRLVGLNDGSNVRPRRSDAIPA